MIYCILLCYCFFNVEIFFFVCEQLLLAENQTRKIVLHLSFLLQIRYSYQNSLLINYASFFLFFEVLIKLEIFD